MQLGSSERAVLSDVCRDVNRGAHDRTLYQSLLNKGLVFRTLVGYWSPTEVGRKLNDQINAEGS
jgi:hypothetical protein